MALRREQLWACFGVAVVAAASCTLDRNGTPVTGGAGPTGSVDVTSTSSLAASSSSSLSTTSSGAGGATTTSTSTSGGGGSAKEDCTNGKDDDGDSLVDCEDPDCSDFVAVPETKLPIGTLNANKCSGGEITGKECGACSTCTINPGNCVLEVAFYDASGCKNAPLYKSAQSGACDKGVGVSLGNNAFYRANEVAAPGSFQCSPGLSPAGNAASFCPGEESASYKSMGKNVTCQPQGVTCVRLPGDAMCPAAFPKKTTFDSKGTCACDCTAVEDCPGLNGTFDNGNNCGQVNHAIMADGKCHDAMLMSVDTLKFPPSQTGTNAKCSDIQPIDTTVCCH